MGQVPHGFTRTTGAVLRAIRHSQESLRALARHHGVNPQTIAKWRREAMSPIGAPGRPSRVTTLSAEKEAVVVAFRRHTLLPLDDCL
ncbi:transposase [Roseomonas rosulenta]|uniref:transposase n=1 Tax=Roseomonas rosulenta TaxID=2748667 RepID=UPI0018DFC027